MLFCVLQILSRRKPVLPQGTFMGVFVMGYGIVRFLVEFVRVPDAQLGYLLGGVITMGQLLSLPLVAAGAVLIVYAQRKARPQCDYLEKERKKRQDYHGMEPLPCDGNASHPSDSMDARRRCDYASTRTCR